MSHPKKKPAPVRLELTTFRLTVGRCNQLSHGALVFIRLQTHHLIKFTLPADDFRLRALRYRRFMDMPRVTVAQGFDGFHSIPELSTKLNSRLYAVHRTQCREERRSIKRNRLPVYRGELSDVIALNQRAPLASTAEKRFVRMQERAVGRPGARRPGNTWRMRDIWCEILARAIFKT